MTKTQFKLLYPLILLTVFSIFGLGINLYAAENKCSEIIDQLDSLDLSLSKKTVEEFRVAPVSVFDRYPAFDYRDFNKILFLSDGGKVEQLFRILDRSDKFYLSADYVEKPGVNILFDNNKLPFKSNSFDFIFMNRGLCACKSSVACGGIASERKAMANFLSQSIEILDKSNPKAMLVLTGFYFPDYGPGSTPDLWVSILKEFSLKYPELQFAVLKRNITRGSLVKDFVGIAVAVGSSNTTSTDNPNNPTGSNNPDNSVEKRLARLKPELLKKNYDESGQ